MLNLLQLIRYFVFVVFVICNAIITSVAVWNSSLVESIISDSASRQIDSFLIFVGASGLLLMFTILFFELYGKNMFLGRVWFELAWTGLFFIMELVGAAVITVQSNGKICAPQGVSSPSRDSSCASTQVLQAFTWVLAILLLGYLTLLSILTAVKRKEDSTIWHASVRIFPLASTQGLKSPPTSPLPRFRSKTPVIVAPTPRRAVPNREPILSYRSGLSLEYEIEHYQAPTTAFLPPVSQQEPSNISNATVTTPLPITPSSPQAERIQQPSQLPSASPLYHSAVRSALEDPPGQPKAPPPADVGSIRRLPPSPPPLGDWPRLDATSRPRTKRKPLPQPSQPQPDMSEFQPQPLQRRPTRPLPPPQPQPQAQPVSSSSYVFDASALTAALQPLASPSRRSKPSGPRRKFNSVDDGRPPLDISNFSSSRSQGFS